jgi:hypothetical protein
MSGSMHAPTIINRPNPLQGQCARKIWSLLRPQDVVGGRMVRKGREFDGGYVMLDHGLKNATVYSFGINDDVSWDLDMVALGCDVYQYDHTIDALPAEHPRMHWHKIGLCGRPTADPALRTIVQLIDHNRHKDRRDIILKMDVEGAEWAMLETVPEATLAQFSQIVMEMHWLHYIDETYHFRRFVECLSKINRTCQSVHVHANNCGQVIFAGGVFLPDTLEVTYVRRSDHTFAPCNKLFPTELDRPCNHNATDFFLGALGLL